VAPPPAWNSITKVHRPEAGSIYYGITGNR
jgi:hypothetical protein